MANEYIYAVARIRAQELTLLNASFMDQLISAENEEAAVRLLLDHGWEGTAEDPEGMLANEHDKTWSLISELVDDMSVFNVFLYAIDYHNLKAAIKESLRGGKHEGIYQAGGTIDPEVLEKATMERDFGALPDHMRAVASEATDILLKTRDGQLCDCLVDQAALNAIYQAGKASGDPLLGLYGEVTVAAADIKTAVRAQRTGKDRDFLMNALAPCDTVNVTRLAQAAGESQEAICSYLEGTSYADAVDELKKSPAAFECWCDNLMIRQIKPQQYQAMGLGPLAAFILARDNEIKTVRIILSGKRNGFSEDFIRERVRETYV